MRRMILAAIVLGVLASTDFVRADDWAQWHPAPDGGNLRWFGAPQGGTPPGWYYGKRLRGGYGCLGYAPVFGPFQGPDAFIPPVDPNHQMVGRPVVPHLPRGMMPDMGFPHELVDPIELGTRRSSAPTVRAAAPTTNVVR